MKGSIQKREYESGNTAYQVYFDIPENSRENLDEGKRPRIIESFEDKSDAENRLRELNYKYHVQQDSVPSGQPFGDLLDDWLNTKESDLSTSTFKNYGALIRNHIDPILGQRSLNELSPAILQDFLTVKKDEKLSGSYRHSMYVVLKGSLDWATRMGKLNSNPMEPVKAPDQSPEQETKILTENEIKKLLATIEEADPWFSAYYHLICNTGLRRGESLGLRWEDVDFQQNTVTIHQQLLYEGDIDLYLDSLKTDYAKRQINLFPPVMKRLKEYRQKQKSKKDQIGEEAFYGHDRLESVDLEEQNFVFTERDGKPIRPGRITKHIKKMCEKADLPTVKFHSIRHTHASMLIKMGVDVKTISNRLGHGSVQFTLDTYGHLLPGQDEEAALLCGQALYSDMVNQNDDNTTLSAVH
jgi:integrase